MFLSLRIVVMRTDLLLGAHSRLLTAQDNRFYGARSLKEADYRVGPYVDGLTSHEHRQPIVVARNGSQNAVLSYAGPSAYLVESFSVCPTFLIFWPTSWVACFVLSTTFSVASFALSAPLSIISLMFSFVEDMNFLLFVEY